MLDPETLALWTQALCDFVNGDVEGPEWERRLGQGKSKRSRAHFESLREHTKGIVQRRIRSRFVPRSSPYVYSTHFAFSGLSGTVTFDRKGHVVLRDARVDNLHSLLAMTIAELQTGKASVEIRECAYRQCDRVFPRRCGDGSGNVGRGQEYCSDACKVEHYKVVRRG